MSDVVHLFKGRHDFFEIGVDRKVIEVVTVCGIRNQKYGYNDQTDNIKTTNIEMFVTCPHCKIKQVFDL